MTQLNSECNFTYTEESDNGTVEFSWHCHRTCTENHQYCIFHQQPAEKSSTEVRDALVKALESEPEEESIDARRRHTEFIGIRADTLDLENTQIAGYDNYPIVLRGASISNLRLKEAEIHHSVDLREATVHDLSAVEAEIGGDLLLKGADIASGDTNQTAASAVPPEVAQHGGPRVGFGSQESASSEESGEVTVAGSKVEGDLVMQGVECWGPFDCSESTIQGELTFFDADIHGNEISLEGANMEQLTLDQTDPGAVNASYAHIHGNATLSALNSGVLEFTGASISGRLQLDDEANCTSLNLSRATIETSANMAEITITQDLELQQAIIDGDLDLSGLDTQNNGDLQLTRASIAGKVLIKNAKIDGSLILSQATLSDDLRGVDLKAGGAEMIDVECYGDLNLSNATVKQRPNLRYATFRKQLKLEGSTLPHGLRAHNATCRDLQLKRCTVEQSDAMISFREAAIHGGQIKQSRSGGVIDLEEATLGEVKLVHADDPRESTINAIRFYGTQFNEFNFSQHYTMLRDADWAIHDSEDAIPHSLTPSSDCMFIQGVLLLLAPLISAIWTIWLTYQLAVAERRQATASVTESLQELETTYQLAKNGASAVGDSRISGELFQQEMHYRHLRYGVEAIAASRSGSRLEAGVGWLSLSVLQFTSKYGEHASWVIWTSGWTILGFTGLFQLLNVEVQPDAGILGALSLSIGSFVTLVFQSKAIGSELGQLLAEFEGFLGAFLIAVFVFALTRSVHR